MKSHSLVAAFFICFNLYAQDKAYIPTDTISALSRIDMRLYHTSATDKALFVTEVSKPKLQRNNELSLFELLQGKISGLDIISASGGPGRNVNALFRGQVNFTDYTPLVVIDGIPQKPISILPLINTNDVLQNLLPVSSEDILSIEILRNDPSALLYGADGAKGVIYIETKKGIAHKPVFTYQFNQSFIPEPTFNKMLDGDEYIMYQLEALHNKYGIINIPSEIAYDRDYPDFYNNSHNTDWIKSVTQPAHTSNHFLNVSGGNKNNLYYGSVNYNNQKGQIINSGYNRFLTRWNFEHYFSDKFTLGVNLLYASNDYNDNVSIEGTDILEMAYIKAPNMSIRRYDSYGRLTEDYFIPINHYQGPGNLYFNPVAVAELGENNRHQNMLQNNLTLCYNIKPWMIFRQTISSQFKTFKEMYFLPNYALGTDWVTWNVPMHGKRKTEEKFINTQSQLVFEAPFADRSNHLLKGAISWMTKSENVSVKDESDPSVLESNLPQKSSNGINAAVYYKLKGRYLININSRIESVRFNKYESKNLDQLYGISLGWQISNEPWFMNSEFLDNVLILAGLSVSEYSLFYNYESPYVYTSPREFDAITKIQNAPSYNLGVRVGLLKKINLEGTYYERKVQLDHPYYGTLKTQNKGWEGSIEYEALKQNNLSWFLHFNLTHNECIITDASDVINNDELRNGSFVRYISENKSPGSIYGLHYEGVYATDQDAYAKDENGNVIYSEGMPVPVSFRTYAFQGGDAHYKDVNYDGVINGSDVLYLGNSDPKFTGGFGSTLEYRNLTLTVNFHFRLGQKITLQETSTIEGFITKNNQSVQVLNRWRQQGDQAPGMMPRAYFEHPANYIGSDFYVESGSFVRMNHISLEYSFKQEWCRKIHLSELTLILSSQRLFTFTHSNAMDPETNEVFNDFTHVNRDNIRLYPPKVYTFSIRLGI